MNQTILASKKEVVANLVDKFNTSKSVVVVEYRGLTVSEISELRKQLRKQINELEDRLEQDV